MHFLRAVYRWVRTPHRHGGTGAALASIVTVLLSFIILVTRPFGDEVSLRAGVAFIGLFSVCLGVGRPRTFWESGILEGWRWFLGDRGVVLIYVTIGLGLAIGAWTCQLNPDVINAAPR